jgi:hypothetical protein
MAIGRLLVLLKSSQTCSAKCLLKVYVLGASFVSLKK